ncbi:rho guanine nucleotide exchange factor 39 isoform X3 [Mobula hypostoma]|uniref:rho guanine nucleotide exchange factor 39 isoform X3 n=1 Tax=Mobula hypostoma TaxID=723540 RepID=UPI002FC278A9
MKQHLPSSDQPGASMARHVQLKYLGGTAVQEQRARWERKRIRTAKELIETERRYFEQLELVVVYFIEILKAKGTLQPAARDAIFCTFKSIHSVNRALLSYLEDGKLGLGFDNFCPHLKLYTTYTDNMEQALKVLQGQIKKNKQFARFKKLQESRPEFQGLTLEDLLPLPCKRIHQYKHLLRDLIGNTNPDDPEFQQLERRKYIREGWLTTVPPKGEELKHRMFFLFSDMLLMTKPCHPLHPVHSDKFVWQKAYPLIEGTVEKVFGHTESQGGLISLTFPEEKVLVMSNDQEDINNWYRCLSAAIGQLQSRSTVIQRKDDLARRPLRSAESSTQMNVASPTPKAGSKRYLSDQPCKDPSHTKNDQTEVKRIKLMPNPTVRFDETISNEKPPGNGCIIL